MNLGESPSFSINHALRTFNHVPSGAFKSPIVSNFSVTRPFLQALFDDGDFLAPLDLPTTLDIFGFSQLRKRETVKKANPDPKHLHFPPTLIAYCTIRSWHQ